MSDTITKKHAYPEGVQHLHGAMFLVPFDLIFQADEEETGEGENKAYRFRNPRLLTERGVSEMLDKKLFSGLRESIKDKTLLNPLICRWREVEGKVLPQLVGGDRRYRVLDDLITKKEVVKDPASAKLNEQGEYEYEYRAANEVYNKVLCQVYSAKSDLEALGLSYAENQFRQNLTAGHDIAMVVELRQCHATDEQIMSIMQKDERWLRDTDALLNGLDENTLKDLIEDRIDRDAAKELMTIDDVEIRHKVLTEANTESAEDHKRRIQRYQKKVMAALEQKEIAEGEVADAEYRGDAQAKEKAEHDVQDADAKVKRTIKERDSQKPVTTTKNVKSAKKAVTGEDTKEPRCLRGPKIKEKYYEYLLGVMKNDGKDTEGGYIISPQTIKLAVKIVRGILDGDEDCPGIVKAWAKKQEKPQE